MRLGGSGKKAAADSDVEAGKRVERVLAGDYVCGRIDEMRVIGTAGGKERHKAIAGCSAIAVHKAKAAPVN